MPTAIQAKGASRRERYARAPVFTNSFNGLVNYWLLNRIRDIRWGDREPSKKKPRRSLDGELQGKQKRSPGGRTTVFVRHVDVDEASDWGKCLVCDSEHQVIRFVPPDSPTGNRSLSCPHTLDRPFPLLPDCGIRLTRPNQVLPLRGRWVFPMRAVCPPASKASSQEASSSGDRSYIS
jgi:hypothetical protein